MVFILYFFSLINHSKGFILQAPFTHSFIQTFIYHTHTSIDTSRTIWGLVSCFRKLPHADWRSWLVDDSNSCATAASMWLWIVPWNTITYISEAIGTQKQLQSCHNSPHPLLHLHEMSHYSKLSIIKLHHNFSVSGSGVGGIFIIMASNWQRIKSKNPYRWLTPQKEALCPPELPPSSLWSWLMFRIFLLFHLHSFVAFCTEL